MTYSIIALDHSSGALGVAVQSHWFGVGSVVPWVQAGVGAVATQATARREYGPELLALLASGVAAPEALRRALTSDEAAASRQVAVIDAQGRIGVHTGSGCIGVAGHACDDELGVSAQANIMRSSGVPEAMLAAYRDAAEGGLQPAERLLAALVAAEQSGGDLRGRQSAALRVSGGDPAVDDVDLRVEDHAEPLDELSRLLQLQRAYALMEVGDAAIAAHDAAGAARAYAAARERAPQHPEIAFWATVAPALTGDTEAAASAFAALPDPDGRWAELLRRLDAAAMLEPGVLDRLLPERR